MKQVYHARLRDHFTHPRNKGRMSDPDFFSEIHNPSCGDSVQMFGVLAGDRVEKLKFEGVGCVISQAAASMLTELALGKTVDEILALDKDAILSMLGIELGPTRLRCGLLALEALQKGIQTT